MVVVAVSVVHEGNRQPRISDKSETCLSSSTRVWGAVQRGEKRGGEVKDGARMGCGAGTRPRPAVQVVRLSFGCRITLLGLSSSRAVRNARHRGRREGGGQSVRAD